MTEITTRPAILNRIQFDIQVWAPENFGNNISKATGAELGSIGPLMGFGEELGEYTEAYEQLITQPFVAGGEYSEAQKKSREEMLDAIADMGIYLFDYASRENMRLALLVPNTIVQDEWLKKHNLSPHTYLVSAYGRLLHANLKRHQGIRGYDDPQKFAMERAKYSVRLLVGLHIIANFESECFEKLIESTWNKIVSKRNWVNNQKDGVVPEVAHDLKNIPANDEDHIPSGADPWQKQLATN